MIKWLNRIGLYTSSQYFVALEAEAVAQQRVKDLETAIADIGNPMKPIILCAPYASVEGVQLKAGQQIVVLPSAHHARIVNLWSDPT